MISPFFAHSFTLTGAARPSLPPGEMERIVRHRTTRRGESGHVNIRTRGGFASDYHSKDRCVYPLVAVYAKFNS
jgi:hypothetical protein